MTNLSKGQEIRKDNLQQTKGKKKYYEKKRGEGKIEIRKKKASDQTPL